MRNLLLTLAACSCLSACSPFNSSYNNLQFNGAAAALPSDYRDQVAAAVAGQAHLGPLLASDPTQTLGVTALSPRQWYVCVRSVGASDTIVLFDEFGHNPSIMRAAPTDSPMCDGLHYAAWLKDH